MSGKLFVSGDEAVALAVRQAKPHVIAAYLKTYSARTIRNVFWSGNNYALPVTPAGSSKKLTYWYGDDEKKERRSNIRFIKRHFPQIRIHGIPKMAHAELVIVHPEEFCRYAEKFFLGQADAVALRDKGR